MNNFTKNTSFLINKFCNTLSILLKTARVKTKVQKGVAFWSRCNWKFTSVQCTFYLIQELINTFGNLVKQINLSRSILRCKLQSWSNTSIFTKTYKKTQRLYVQRSFIQSGIYHVIAVSQSGNDWQPGHASMENECCFYCTRVGQTGMRVTESWQEPLNKCV